jgi:hypothetical protein
MKTPRLLLITLAILTVSCSKRAPSYESHFNDVITVDYPPKYSISECERLKEKIDADLRASNSGFFSGVMGSGHYVDDITIDTDFDKVDEQALVARFVELGWLPKDGRVKYERDPYGARARRESPAPPVPHPPAR